jgi:hypothetical protein
MQGTEPKLVQNMGQRQCSSQEHHHEPWKKYPDIPSNVKPKKWPSRPLNTLFLILTNHILNTKHSWIKKERNIIKSSKLYKIIQFKKISSLSNLYIYAIWIQNLFSEHILIMNKPCKPRINNISSQCINQTNKN